MNERGKWLGMWEFGLWAMESHGRLLSWEAVGWWEWKELTQTSQAGSRLLQAPPRMPIPLTRRKLSISPAQ